MGHQESLVSHFWVIQLVPFMSQIQLGARPPLKLGDADLMRTWTFVLNSSQVERDEGWGGEGLPK